MNKEVKVYYFMLNANNKKPHELT